MVDKVANIIPADFAANSRLWIFQSNRPFQDTEVREIDEQLHNFYVQWQSHGTPVKGWAKCVFNYFVVVVADENASGVSGCSTDGMVRLIKSFERQYNVNLFDRLQLSFLVKDKVQPLPMSQVSYALQNGYIETDTLLFNNTVLSKQEFEEKWLVPLNESWLWQRITATAS
ncbi:MAG: hypothetical protein RL660_1300 [Bacteroidota bacterium]|jgi:hypothetical protein